MRNRTIGPIVVILAMAVIASCGQSTKQDTAPLAFQHPSFDTLWNYNDPSGTRGEFEAVLPSILENGDQSLHLQLQTQIARTLGLDGNFDSAHAVLDVVDSLATSEMPVVRVRSLLERGRTFRSSGQAETSIPLFRDSYTLGRQSGADFHAIDAAHMMALVVEGVVEKMRWNQIGIELAEQSDDPKAKKWLGSLLNNMGWDRHGRDEFDEALTAFERALTAREAHGTPEDIRIARWCIARCLRSLGHLDSALVIQTSILETMESSGESDGYVVEELGELYLAKDDSVGSHQFFQRAFDLLSEDSWLVENEGQRLERLKTLAQ